MYSFLRYFQHKTFPYKGHLFSNPPILTWLKLEHLIWNLKSLNWRSPTTCIHQFYLHFTWKKNTIVSEKSASLLCCHCKATILIFMWHKKIRLASLWLHRREMLSWWPFADVEHVSATSLSAVPIMIPGIVNTECTSVKKVMKYIATLQIWYTL